MFYIIQKNTLYKTKKSVSRIFNHCHVYHEQIMSVNMLNYVLVLTISSHIDQLFESCQGHSQSAT